MSERFETFVDVDPSYRLWVQATGDRGASPLLLIMGANASGVAWPDALVDALAERHLVVRYDHRDTGRSTQAFDERPYPLRTLADDAVAILDALGLDRVHAVGMSMGGMLLQLLLVDHPERLLSATLIGVAAVDDDEAPGPTSEVLELWSELGEERDPAAEQVWQIAHWRALNGPVLPFDAAEFEALERRVADHRGSDVGATAHAVADQAGLERDLSEIVTPVLVIDAPEDPVAPPPTAARLADRIPTARLVTVAGMGHALPSAVIGPLVDTILAHASAADPLP